MNVRNFLRAGEAVIPILELVESASDVFPPLKSASGGALHIARLVKKFKSNRKDWDDFRTYLLEALTCVVWLLPSDSEPADELKRQIAVLLKTIEEIIEEIKTLQELNGINRFWEFTKDPERIQQFKGRLDETFNLFQLGASITTGFNVTELRKDINNHLARINEKLSDIIVSRIAQRSALDNLPYAKGASWNQDRVCLKGTRKPIIDAIFEWIHDPNPSTSVFWLAEVAGAGKTAVAHTVSQRCNTEGILLSSFFFDRNDPTRNDALFSTIASDLSRVNNAFADQIATAIEKKRTLLSPPMSHQFDELILAPCLQHPPERPLVIVIDALDEGYNEELLMLLRDKFSRLPAAIRIVITSRPDLHIERFLLRREHIHVQSLDIPEQGNIEDIAVYARHRLRQLAEWDGLGEGWPGDELMAKFVGKAEGLFIWVATITNFLRDMTNPTGELRKLVDDSSTSKLSSEQKMDALYSAILTRCNWDDDDFVRGYNVVMGAILAAKEPLSVAVWQAMYAGSVQVYPIIHRIGALLIGINATDQPLRILHQSFRDFVTIRASSSEKSRRFYIEEVLHHQELALVCLRVLNTELAHDIPGLGYLRIPQEPRSIPAMEFGVIPRHLWYACRFWMDHTTDVVSPSPSLMHELEIFLGEHVISWIEISASLGRFQTLEKIRTWLVTLVSLPMPILWDTLSLSELCHALNRLTEDLRYMGRWEEALDASSEAVLLSRRLGDAGHITPSSSLGVSLRNYSIELFNFGLHDEALAAGEEALKIYRELAIEQPDRFAPDLARSLRILPSYLSFLGRSEEAFRVSTEAVASYRELLKKRPDAFAPDLAASLQDLSITLADFGRHEEAFAASEEAATCYRQLFEKRPDRFAADLASSLQNLSLKLTNLGRHEEALAASEKAVASYRELFKKRPDTFAPSLAHSLQNLSVDLTTFGRHDEALATSEEVVASYRELFKKRPATFAPNLASSLQNLSLKLTNSGRHEDALAASTEAVASYRELFKKRPDTFAPNLASSLQNLSVSLTNVGRDEEALAASEEVVVFFRELLKKRPDTIAPYLASSLRNLSVDFTAFGRHEEALAASEEAVASYRELFKKRPETFAPDLALALQNQSVRLTNSARYEEALAASEEAASSYRELYKKRPDIFARNLTSSLKTLLLNLAALGRHDKALAVSEEVVASYRELVAKHPNEFPHHLAQALYRLSVDLSKVGRDQEACVAVQEAVSILRPLAKKYTVTHSSNMITYLRCLSRNFSQLGNAEASLRAGEEADEWEQELGT